MIQFIDRYTFTHITTNIFIISYFRKVLHYTTKKFSVPLRKKVKLKTFISISFPFEYDKVDRPPPRCFHVHVIISFNSFQTQRRPISHRTLFNRILARSKTISSFEKYFCKNF